jgi:hypothetical protein
MTRFITLDAIKTCLVTCRSAKPGEKVTTLVDNGNFIETQNTVPTFGAFVVVSNLLTNQHCVDVENSYIISKTKFDNLYQRIGTTHHYRPTSGAKKVYVVNEDISFKAPWGEMFYLKKGGVLVPDGEGFYGINPLEFASTYSQRKSL